MSKQVFTFKTACSRLIIRWLAWASAVVVASSVFASNMGLISIKVTEHTDRDRQNTSALTRHGQQHNPNNETKLTETQTRSMTIEISNRSNKPIDRARVKYWLFARDQSTRGGSVITEGEQQISLKALGSTSFETRPAQIKSETVRSQNQPQAGQKLGATRTGQRYAGFGVVVFDADGKVLAENFSAQGMREIVAGELPADDNPWRLRR